MEENKNLELWSRVERTDPKHTKKAKIGGLEITAVAPQHQILNATREFGIYGKTWGFKNIDLDYNLIDKFNLVVFKGTFFFPDGYFQIINSSKMYMDRAQKMVDADFAKKIETDALTKALSKMGFNADIFMGRFDDTKYVEERKEEFKEKAKLSKEGYEFYLNTGTIEQVEKALTNRAMTPEQRIELTKLTNK